MRLRSSRRARDEKKGVCSQALASLILFSLIFFLKGKRLQGVLGEKKHTQVQTFFSTTWVGRYVGSQDLLEDNAAADTDTPELVEFWGRLPDLVR